MKNKRPRIKVPCAQCKKQTAKFVHRVQYNKKHGYKNYCSSACKNKSKLTGTHEACANCTKPVWVTDVTRRRSKSGKFFCSRRCATIVNNSTYKSGETHPNFTKGRASYRDRAFKAYGIKCSVCGYAVKQVLEVHHIDCNRDNNRIKNLAVLCPTHHKEIQLHLITLPKGVK